MEPPYSPATMPSVSIERQDNGTDAVWIYFEGHPGCSVKRVTTLPTGSPRVEGIAFLLVTCAPIKDTTTAAAGSSAARRWPAPPGAVNVTEMVLTYRRGGLIVLTIGLRRSAPWGVGGFGGDGGGGPIVGVWP
jgi:hypothetical protein